MEVEVLDAGEFAGVPLLVERLGDPVDVPPARPMTVWVVSRLAAEAIRRDDLVYPADVVRDDDGRVVGCRAFGVVSR
jgi:hypothetical protein